MKKLLRNSSILAVAASLFAGVAMADVEFISQKVTKNADGTFHYTDMSSTGKIPGYSWDWTWMDQDHRFKWGQHYHKDANNWSQVTLHFGWEYRGIDNEIIIDDGDTLQLAMHSNGRISDSWILSLDGPRTIKFSEWYDKAGRSGFANNYVGDVPVHYGLYRIVPTVDRDSVTYIDPVHNGNVVIFGAHNNEIRDGWALRVWGKIADGEFDNSFYWAKDLGAQTNWDFTGNQTLDNNISSVFVPEGKIMIGYDGPNQTGNALIIPPGRHNVFDMYQGYDGWNDIISSIKIVDLPEQWQYSTKGLRSDTFQLYGAVGKQVGLTEFGHYNGGHAGGWWMYQPLPGQDSGSLKIDAIPEHTFNRNQNATVRLENGVSGINIPKGMAVEFFTTFDQSGKAYRFGEGWWDHDALALMGLADNIKSWRFADQRDTASVHLSSYGPTEGGSYFMDETWSAWTPASASVNDLTVTQTRDLVRTETWGAKTRTVTLECAVDVKGLPDRPVPYCQNDAGVIRLAGEKWDYLEVVEDRQERSTFVKSETREIDNPAFVDTDDMVKIEQSLDIPVRNEGGEVYHIVPANVDQVEEETKGKHSYPMPTWSQWVDVQLDQGVDVRDLETIKQVRQFPHATLNLASFEIKTFECSIEVRGREDEVAPSCDDYAASQQLVKVGENTYERKTQLSSTSMVSTGEVTNQEREVPNSQYAPRELVIDLANNNGTQEYDSIADGPEGWNTWSGFLSVRAVRGGSDANLSLEELELVYDALGNLRPAGGVIANVSQGGNSISSAYDPLLPSVITINNPAAELGVQASYEQFMERLEELGSLSVPGFVDVEFNPAEPAKQ